MPHWQIPMAVYNFISVWYKEINRLVCSRNMAFQWVTCTNCIIISQTEYPFLSQQSVMSVGKRAGFLSSNWISELVWDSEREEAGASSDRNFHLRKRIFRIFRQQLKYLCFSYSFLDRVWKYHVDIINSPSWKIYWKLWRKLVYWNSKQQKLVCLCSWWCGMWIPSGVKRKVVSEVLRM